MYTVGVIKLKSDETTTGFNWLKIFRYTWHASEPAACIIITFILNVTQEHTNKLISEKEQTDVT